MCVRDVFMWEAPMPPTPPKPTYQLHDMFPV